MKKSLPLIFLSLIFLLSAALRGENSNSSNPSLESAPAGETLVSGKAQTAQGWESIAAPLGTAPNFSKSSDTFPLEIELPTAAAYGKWQTEVPVQPGTGCAISACAKIELASAPELAELAEKSQTAVLYSPEVPNCEGAGNSCMILLTWLIPGEKNPCQRDYVNFTDTLSETETGRPLVERKFTQTFAVPENAESVRIECVFKWRTGKASFLNVETAAVPVPAPNLVRLVAANPHTVYPGSIQGNLNAMEETLQRIFREVERPDLILFSECFTDTGAGLPIQESAELLPGGPTFQLLSRYAKEHKVWIAANVHEVTPEKTYHNSSFLVNREGELAGVYRKVHLTVSEGEKGVLPGKEFPVFETDFGKVGFVICWDNWFSESAKILRRKGAELLLFPLAGDGKESHWSKIWSARAIDTSLPMVVTTQQAHLPSAIIDRDGEWLAQTTEKNGFAWIELDLNERKRSFWLSVGPSMGDPYQLYLHESRPETYK